MRVKDPWSSAVEGAAGMIDCKFQHNARSPKITSPTIADHGGVLVQSTLKPKNMFSLKYVNDWFLFTAQKSL